MKTMVGCAALALSAVAALAQANFAGTWVLDAKRSQGLPEGVEMTMTVKQDGNRVQTETSISSPQGQQTIPDLYVLDGKETDYQPVIGGDTRKGKRTAMWNADKSGLESTERATMIGPEGEVAVTAKRIWTLSADGKTLTIDVTLNTPAGAQVSKRVFAKKG